MCVGLPNAVHKNAHIPMCFAEHMVKPAFYKQAMQTIMCPNMLKLSTTDLFHTTVS